MKVRVLHPKLAAHGAKVKAAYPQSIRLSDMVFTHELCQLIFLEQLYRAHEILKGSGYHH